MKLSVLLVALACLACVLVLPGSPCQAMDIVKDGNHAAVIVVLKDDTAADAAIEDEDVPPEGGGGAAKRGGGGPRGFKTNSVSAAELLASWVKKMSGVTLPIVDQAPPDGQSILIGKAALQAGLKLDDIKSISHEGFKVVVEGKKVLIAGQNGRSTVKAVCTLLEELGCHYYNDQIGELGEEYPHTKTVTIKDNLKLSMKPGMMYRKVGGSGWYNQDLWGVWNGVGGVPMSTAHSWGNYVPKALLQTHPEYFALIGGQRTGGAKADWYCTTNPELRKVFAENVIKAIASGNTNPSISPPDGTAYCQCDKCKAQDDPNSIEPSSGKVCITNRYVDFFNAVAKIVGEKYPNSLLSFYVYADYTQAPTNNVRVADNLVPFLAPIRYCRYHRTGHPDCESRIQLQQMIDGWAKLSKQFAYRTYNFNLAECTVPFSLLDTWKHDIPMLANKGCIAIVNESLGGWNIYGPFLYQSTRLMYDPSADNEKLMDDYYMGFYGPKAGPAMKEYWSAVDKAFVDMKCHAGGFPAVTEVWEPNFIAKCKTILDKATEAAKDDPKYSARVAMAVDGYLNAVQYRQMCDEWGKGDFAAAKKTYDTLLARANAAVADRHGGMNYTITYIQRFLGKVLAGPVAAAEPPRKVLTVLPDKMKLMYGEPSIAPAEGVKFDFAAAGEAKGYAKVDCDDSSWKVVSTYAHTISAQGMPDTKAVMWYRTKFEVPAQHGKLSLVVGEIDGAPKIYINGKKIEKAAAAKPEGDVPNVDGANTEAAKPAPAPAGKKGPRPAGGPDIFPKRASFEVDITDVAVPGVNTIAFCVDHTNISELFLGGILRPIAIVDRGDLPLADVPKPTGNPKAGAVDKSKAAAGKKAGGAAARKAAGKNAGGKAGGNAKPAPDAAPAPAEDKGVVDPGIGG